MSDKSLSRKTLEVLAANRTTIKKQEQQIEQQQQEIEQLKIQINELKLASDELQKEVLLYQKKILDRGMKTKSSNIPELSPYQVNLS